MSTERGAKKLPGVVAVVRDGTFLGVIAKREEQAVRAREHLVRTSSWIGGDTLPDARKLHDRLVTMKSDDEVVSEQKAPPPSGIARVFEATFTKPYIAHAAIAPSCALAQFESGKLTVWSHTQGVFPLRRDLARALKLDQDADPLHSCRGRRLLRPQRRRRCRARRRALGARG